ncbi:MAG TPA: hypothetical protein VGY53_10155, partial [Isosphaeraceae bacterium]|nr:hypothetical protein [Isosphaeraceae bacterium]
VDSRNSVLLVLFLVMVLGGGRRLFLLRRARSLVARLDKPDVTPEEVFAAAEHHRLPLMDLFRLLHTAPEAAVREAAGRALAILWEQDELVPEEEKAVVRRGFVAEWNARKRYPRTIRGPIPITVDYGVPFLTAAGPGVRADRLEWSHRITGAQRASLETQSAWVSGPGRVQIELQPYDFPTKGPSRVGLQARVRTRGLTSEWELELPHIPFTFEFDPLLSVESILTLPDATRAESIARAIQLEPVPAQDDGPRFLDLSENLVLRDPPVVVVTAPLECDLAHGLAIEIEGVPGRFEAGSVILSGQGSGNSQSGRRVFPLDAVRGIPANALEQPGERRIRAVLTSDPHRGWADAEIRSVWPGTITTDWVPVQIMRR